VRCANDTKVCNTRLAAIKSSCICAPDGPEDAITIKILYIYDVYNVYAHYSMDQGHELNLGTITSFCHYEEQFVDNYRLFILRGS